MISTPGFVGMKRKPKLTSALVANCQIAVLTHGRQQGSIFGGTLGGTKIRAMTVKTAQRYRRDTTFHLLGRFLPANIVGSLRYRANTMDAMNALPSTSYASVSVPSERISHQKLSRHTRRRSNRRQEKCSGQKKASVIQDRFPVPRLSLAADSFRY